MDGEKILIFPFFSIMMYVGISTNINNPFSSDIDNLILGMLYLMVVIDTILDSRRNSENLPVDVILPISMALIYGMYLLFFSHNMYLLSFHHVLYAVFVIILQEKLTRNIIKNNRIEATRESMENSTVIISTLLVLLTISLFFVIFMTYLSQLERNYTGSFIDFLLTPPIVVWMITFFCVVVYNYLMYRRLLPLVVYVEGSDDQI